jgi:hypothetical protein
LKGKCDHFPTNVLWPSLMLLYCSTSRRDFAKYETTSWRKQLAAVSLRLLHLSELAAMCFTVSSLLPF